MVYNSYTPQRPRSGFDNFGQWFSEIFQMFGAKWSVWVLQGLLVSIPFMIVVIGYAVAFIIPMMGAGNRANRDPFSDTAVSAIFVILMIVGGIISAIWSLMVFPGMVGTALKQIRGEEISVGDLFSGTRFGWGYFVIGLAISLGVLACCVGVIFTNALFCLALPILVDRKVKPVEALTASYEATKGDMWFFLIFFMVVNMVVSAAAGILNAVSCGVLGTLGLCVSYPIYAITMVVAYERTFNGYSGIGMPMMQQGVPIPPPYMPTPGTPTIGSVNDFPPQEPEAPVPPVPPTE